MADRPRSPSSENAPPPHTESDSSDSDANVGPLVILNASQMMLLFIICALLGFLGSLINPAISYVFVALAAAIVTFGFLGGVAQVKNNLGTFGGAVGVFVAVLVMLFQFASPESRQSDSRDLSEAATVTVASPVAPRPAKVAAAESTTQREQDSATGAFSIIGKWQQFFFEAGTWNSGGTYEFGVNDIGELRIRIVDQPSGNEATTRLFDVQLDGSRFKTDGDSLVFRSDWGVHGVGTFHLKRQNPDLYAGSAFEEDGTEYRKNEFRRVPGSMLE